nr:carboxypeptidase regulatory-like domain-containing protein [Planctomycetota bacterium]
GGPWGQKMELAWGDTRRVDLGTGHAIVSGMVTDRGRPKRLAVVTFTAEGVKRWVQTNQEGKYRVYGLEAGDCRVTLALPGQQDILLADREIKIPATGQVRLDFDISAGSSSETGTGR